jgi:amino acid transporter
VHGCKRDHLFVCEYFILTWYLSSFSFYFLAVLSLLIFRYTEPDLKRPYRVWLSTPILFCMVALFLCTTPFIEAPIESLIALSFVLLAIPIWFVYVKYKETLSKGWNSKYQCVYKGVFYGVLFLTHL